MSAPDFAQLMHPDFGPPLQWWHYTDTFAVAGFINRNKTRITKQAIRNGAHCYWHDPMGPLPIYGAQLLAERPDAPVLVLETERAADAARVLFPSHVCVTWPGGSTAVDKADTMPFAGRDVVLWPDNDGESWTAMNRLQVRMRGLPRTLVQIAMPATWPDKWDLTWPPPAGATIETLQQMLRAVTPSPYLPPPAFQPLPTGERPALSAAEGSTRAQRALGEEASKPYAMLDDKHLARAAAPSPGADAPTSPRWGEVTKHALNAQVTVALPIAAEPPGSAGVPLAHEQAGGPRSQDEAWPEPDFSLLDGRHRDLPTFPPAVLPRFWRDWCHDASRGIGVPLDDVALALLTTGAGLIGGARRISPVPMWSEPCVLWTALVGGPASGKTSAMDAVLRLVRALDNELADTNAALHRRHVTERETARAEEGWWRDGLRGAVANHREPQQIPAAAQAPRPFAPRRLVIETPAADVVADALRGSPRGTLLVLDDLAAWRGCDARQARIDRRWWSATSWIMERKGGRARIDIPCAAVSVLGAIDADAITTRAGGADDGISPRLLFAWPSPRPVQSLSRTAEALCPEARAALGRLRDLDDQPRVAALSPDALADFEDFRRRHEEAADRLDDIEGAWWGMGIGNILRLAGVIAFLEWAPRADETAEPAIVPAHVLQAAADLWQQYLWPHARAVFRSADGHGAQRLSRVLRWLRLQGAAEVSRTTLREVALSRTCDAAETAYIAETLARGGWLKPIETVSQRKGRPPVRWAVHPHLRCAAETSVIPSKETDLDAAERVCASLRSGVVS